MRVLKWMVERVRGTAGAEETPIGFIPTLDALDTNGLQVPVQSLREALRVDAGEWLDALQDLDEFYGKFGARMPAPIVETLAETRRRFGADRRSAGART
jgi:phosphoenolpyruvate carboxykinase (GTP)